MSQDRLRDLALISIRNRVNWLWWSHRRIKARKRVLLISMLRYFKQEKTGYIEVSIELYLSNTSNTRIAVRGVTRGKGLVSPGAESLQGAPKSFNNLTSTFCSWVHLLPKDLRLKTWERQTCFFPWPPSNFVTSLIELNDLL